MIIDVSKWQGKVNWDTVRHENHEIEGVYIKASEGIGYRDPYLINNAVEATKSGFKVGFYHFATLNNTDVANDAREEAKYFLTVTKNLTVEYPFVLDIERNDSKTPKDKVLLWVKTFFNELEVEGVKDYCLYSYTSFLNENLPANHGLGNVPLWIAAYSDNYKVPNGWIKPWLWQYSQKGQIIGITGNVDLNKRV